MRIPTLYDITTILRNIVKGMPKDLESTCDRLNTFAWLFAMSDLNATNAEVTYKKYRNGEFYVRNYEKTNQKGDLITQYPVLAVDNVTATITNLLAPSFKIYNFDFSVWDLYVPAGTKEGCTRCEDRTRKQVEIDTENMLEYVLKELVDFILISNGTNEYWVTSTWFSSVLNTCFDPREYYQVCAISPYLQSPVNITREWGGQDNLVGATARLRIKIARSCTNDIEVDYCDVEPC